FRHYFASDLTTRIHLPALPSLGPVLLAGPLAVWRAGMDKIEAAARAVDMPLCLDNANALPTYPQQKQKQQEAA
ncbi:MAG TPA: hypothetical protein VKG91_17160, partial [Roseiarcus sp.]|nr:hypothetical protein [Roseiarcus sp.]